MTAQMPEIKKNRAKGSRIFRAFIVTIIPDRKRSAMGVNSEYSAAKQGNRVKRRKDFLVL
jgi:hypothetical protein